MKRILVVEDDEFIRDLMTTKLSSSGYQIDAARTGEEALEKAVEGFDAILLDLKLPTISGVDVLKRLKEDGGLEQTRVIVFSNIDDPATREKCRALGAAAFLIKFDTDLDDLVTQIDEVLA